MLLLFCIWDKIEDVATPNNLAGKRAALITWLLLHPFSALENLLSKDNFPISCLLFLGSMMEYLST
jgi:hypothetical protein